jgi:hypothetical protein
MARLEHASANEFIGVWIEDDVVKRLWITIENRCHDTVAGRGYRISEDLFGLWAPQQKRERFVGGPFSPFSEQMEDEKQRGRLRPSSRLSIEIVLDSRKEPRNHLGTLRAGGLQCLSGKAFRMGELVEDFRGIHGDRLSETVLHSI